MWEKITRKKKPCLLTDLEIHLQLEQLALFALDELQLLHQFVGVVGAAPRLGHLRLQVRHLHHRQAQRPVQLVHVLQGQGRTKVEITAG